MAAASNEINLSALPPNLERVKGNMTKVFYVIYTEFSQIDTESDYENNNSIYKIRDAPPRICVFRMPDGNSLDFSISMHDLHAYPESEISISLGQSPDSLYLEAINKSLKLSGAEATNYAYEIAAAFGAKWLHVWDAAHIECDTSVNDMHSYPLSLYRALTKPGTHPSWYENVALKHGFTSNNPLSEIYNYTDVIARLRLIKLDELLTYYKTVEHFIESGQAKSYIYIDRIKSDGVISGDMNLFEDEGKATVLRQLRKIIDILSASEKITLVDFLMAPSKACLDKGYILRSFPGAGNIDFEIPNILFDADNEKLCEFPYLIDSLIVSKTSGHPVIKLSRGGKRRSRKMSERGKRIRSRRHI